MIRKFLFILLLSGLYACNNNKNEPSGQATDTTAVNETGTEQQQTYNDEDQNQVTDVNEYIQIGNVFTGDAVDAFLSKMLRQTVLHQDYPEGQSTINITLVKEEVWPLDFSEQNPLKKSVVKSGCFQEGFGGLRNAFMTSFNNKENWDFETAITKLSAINYKKETAHSQAFTHANPDLINWCFQNFYLAPSQRNFTDVSNNTIYDVVFKKFVRTLFIARLELIGYGIENEVSWYRNAVIMEQKHAPALLTERYKLSQQYSKEDLNDYYFPYACGFWIRRNIDGSDVSLIPVLERVLQDYDANWWRSKQK